VPVISIVAAVSIQEFIFRTNKLREQVAASKMVEDAFDFWTGKPVCVFAGGGQAVLRFDSLEAAHRQVFEWTREWLEKAPGLRIAAAHLEYSAEEDAADAWREVKYRLLPRAEAAAAPGSELGALPLVQQCPISRLGASRAYDGAWISAEAYAKHTYRVDDSFSDPEAESIKRLPRDIDNLGLLHQASQMAVCVVDGDGLGDFLLENVFQKYRGKPEFLKKLEDASKKLAQVTEGAARDTLAKICEHAEALNAGDAVRVNLRTLPDSQDTYYAPFRRIFVGGDDAIWICPARIAFGAVTFYQQRFRELSRSILGEERSASAGIAITGAGFPFARAVHIAESRLGDAKKCRRDNGSNGAWLDYRLVMEGSISAEAESSVYHGGPWTLDETFPDESFAWSRFEEIWRHFHKDWKRSRAKTLFQKYGEGIDAVEECAGLFEKQKYMLPQGIHAGNPEDLELCYSPLELLDFYPMPLDWKPEVASHAA
jgi:hypothetical protein